MDVKLFKNFEIDLLVNLLEVEYYVVFLFMLLNFMIIDVDEKCKKIF